MKSIRGGFFFLKTVLISYLCVALGIAPALQPGVLSSRSGVAYAQENSGANSAADSGESSSDLLSTHSGLLPMERSDAVTPENRAETLLQAFRGEFKNHPDDLFRLLENEPLAGRELSARELRRIQLRFYRWEGNARIPVREKLERFLFEKSGQEGFHFGEFPQFAEPVEMEIWAGEERVHRFSFEITGAAFYQSYLFLKTSDGFSDQNQAEVLRLLDLNRYGQLIGNSRPISLPLPVPAESAGERFSIRDGVFHYGETMLPAPVIEELSATGERVANVAATISNPENLAEMAAPLDELMTALREANAIALEETDARIDQTRETPFRNADFAEAFEEHLEGLRDRRALDQHLKDKGVDVATLSEQEARNEVVKRFAAEYATQHQSSEALLVSKEAVLKQRRLLSRFREVVSLLTFPRASSSQDLLGGMAYVAAGAKGFYQGNLPDRAKLGEGLLQLMNHKVVKYGVAPLGVMLVAAHYPEVTHQFMHQSLDISRHLVTSFAHGAFQTVKNLGLVAGDSLNTVSQWLRDPFASKDAYFSEQKLPKTMHVLWTLAKVGLGSVIGFHTLVNLADLVRDLKEDGNFQKHVGDLENRGLAKRWGKRVASVFPWFKERQDRIREEYYRDAGKAQLRGLDQLEFTPEQHELAEKLVHEVSERDKGLFKKLVDRFSTLELVKTVAAVRDRMGSNGLVAFGKSISQFFISMPTFARTNRAFIQLQNYSLYPVRTFVWNPLTLLPAYLAYPEFFFKSVHFSRTESGESVFRTQVPSEWSGGTRNVFQTIGKFFRDKEYRENLKKWEERMAEFEWEVQREASRVAYEATLTFTNGMPAYEVFLQEGEAPAFDSRSLKKMTRESRAFYRHAFNAVFEASMLKLVLASAEQLNFEFNEQISHKELKDTLVRRFSELSMDDVDVRELVTETARETDFTEAVEKKSRITGDADRWITDLKYKLLSKINHPKRKAMQRMVEIDQGLRDASLNLRVATKQLLRFIVDLPLELAMMFLMFAGATAPELVMVQDEMFSSTSWNYMSTLVLKAWLVGTLMTLPSGGWGDMQMFFRQSVNFGKNVPDESEKSLLGWYYKNGLRAKGNELFSNWKEFNRIVTANIPSYLSLAVILNLLTFGRFELDFYLTGYLIYYATPLLGAFPFKLQNAFEHSSDFYFKDFPEELRGHPRVQEYVTGKKGWARLKFQFWFALLYENFIWSLVDAAKGSSVASIGPRSLTKTLFGGKTPVEWIAPGFDKLRETLGIIPGAAKVINACENLLTNNHPLLPGK